MKQFKSYLLWALVGLLTLTSACANQVEPLRIGAKDFTEQYILAEMVVRLAEAEGIPADVVPLLTTQMNLEALKQGDIDMYVEYNGTGLLMLGQQPVSDGDEATARVVPLYEPLGLVWGERLGFSNNYGILMTPERAESLGVQKISDLIPQASTLNIGIEDEFAVRPLDGFDPFQRRYGMEFGSVEIISSAERGQLYDLLLEGQVDVIDGFTTDGQIADYELIVLEDDLGFFPIYEPAPLFRAGALEQFPAIKPALDQLSQKISPDMMQDLNRQVDLGGQPVEAVAQAALVQLGLVEGDVVESDAEPLVVAISPLASEQNATNVAQRAIRRAFSGRDIVLETVENPLEAVGAGDARIALAGAELFFDVDGEIAALNDRYEAVVAVDNSLIHLVASSSAPSTLDRISTIGVPEDDQSSQLIAELIQQGLVLNDSEIIPLAATTSQALLDQLDAGAVDAVLIHAPLADGAFSQAYSAGDYQLLSLDAWAESNNVIRFPFLRLVRVPADTYSGQTDPVETLSTQSVIAGPAPVADFVGDHGPGGGNVERVLPVSDSSVVELNEALKGPAIDPILPMARVLQPT